MPGPSMLLRASARDADGDALSFTYVVTGGRVSGDVAEATWDLSDLEPGAYTATVDADDACGCVAFASARVKVSCKGPAD